MPARRFDSTTSLRRRFPKLFWLATALLVVVAWYYLGWMNIKSWFYKEILWQETTLADLKVRNKEGPYYYSPNGKCALTYRKRWLTPPPQQESLKTDLAAWSERVFGFGEEVYLVYHLPTGRIIRNTTDGLQYGGYAEGGEIDRPRWLSNTEVDFNGGTWFGPSGWNVPECE